MLDDNDSQQLWDAVVVGGGAAGLAAAVALARSRRSVTVVDAGEPRNAPAEGVHNLLGREGVAPTELVAQGRRELAGYGGTVREGRVTTAERVDEGFVVGLDDGTSLRARRVVLATGLVDDLPDVPGLAERWGHEVLHCPFCHGWEARDRRIGVLVTSPGSWHQAGMWRQLSDDVTVLLHTGPAPDPATRDGLTARGVHLVEGEVVRVRSDADALRGVVLADGTALDLDVLVVAPVFRARTELVEAFGLEIERVELEGRLMATKVAAAPDGSTSVPGLWVAGNLVDPMAQVAAATAGGLMAGARVNGDLVAEDLRTAAAAAAAG